MNRLYQQGPGRKIIHSRWFRWIGFVKTLFLVSGRGFIGGKKARDSEVWVGNHYYSYSQGLKVIELPEPSECWNHEKERASKCSLLVQGCTDCQRCTARVGRDCGRNTLTPFFSHCLIAYHFYPFTKHKYKPAGKAPKNRQSAGPNFLGQRRELGRIEIKWGLWGEKSARSTPFVTQKLFLSFLQKSNAHLQHNTLWATISQSWGGTDQLYSCLEPKL